MNRREQRRLFHQRRAAHEKEISALKKAAGLRNIRGSVPIEDIEARLAEIPQDTRTFQQRLLGDPIFERSALYRRQ